MEFKNNRVFSFEGVKFIFVLLSVLLILFCRDIYAQKITEEQWQRQIDSLTFLKYKIKIDLLGLDKTVDSLKSDNKKLDSVLNAKKEDMYKILDVNSYQVSEYKKKIWDLYNRIENRIGDYESLCSELEEISKSRIRLLYEFRKPFDKMKENMGNFNK